METDCNPSPPPLSKVQYGRLPGSVQPTLLKLCVPGQATQTQNQVLTSERHLRSAPAALSSSSPRSSPPPWLPSSDSWLQTAAWEHAHVTPLNIHMARAQRELIQVKTIKEVKDGGAHLFSMILLTMSSVVRLFPLSMGLNIPLFLGS